MKLCGKCKKYKSTELFHKNKRNKDTLCTYCKECRLSYEKRQYKKVPNKFRAHTLKRLYGITLQQYENMLENQKGNCAICEKDSKSLSRKLHVDHCHTTGKIRGLLCSNCNTGLGNLKENKNLLLKAIKYIEEFE